jgi:hypothetical protein
MFASRLTTLGKLRTHRNDYPALEKSNFVARRLLTASIIYLPIVLLIMLLDKNR